MPALLLTKHVVLRLTKIGQVNRISQLDTNITRNSGFLLNLKMFLS